MVDSPKHKKNKKFDYKWEFQMGLRNKNLEVSTLKNMKAVAFMSYQY